MTMMVDLLAKFDGLCGVCATLPSSSFTYIPKVLQLTDKRELQ